jgi:hypothetical protein
MSGTGDYVLGIVGLALVVVSIAVAGRTLRRAVLPGWSGAPALLASGLLAIATLVVISELLGLAGLLDGVLLVAASLIVGAGALRLERTVIKDEAPRAKAGPGSPSRPQGGEVRGIRVEPASDPGQRDAPAVGRVELGVAIAIALLVALQWAGPTLLALDRGIYGGDSLWYHMPFAAHIAQTGSVTKLLFTDPLYLNWFYPQVSELIHADGLLLLGNDFLSPLLNLGWLGLALFAAWCCGRPYGAGAPALAAVAMLISANLLFSRQPGNANNDVVAIALMVTSVAILLNARNATARGPLVVAGLAAGLALGTKLTAVPPVLALSVGVIVIAATGSRLRAAGAWLAGLAVGGGLWYLRNLIVAGTPFPFVDLGPLSMPEELQGREPFSIAHYLTDTGVWGRFFRPGLEERLGDLWPLLLLAAVAGVVVWLLRGGRLERMLAAVAVLAAIAYVLTPLGASGPEGTPVGFRLNIRYLAPGLGLALLLAAIPPPLGAVRERWWRLGALGLFGAMTVLNVVHFDPIDADRMPGSVLLALAVIAIPVAFVLLAGRGLSRGALAAGAAVAVVALAVGGRAVQKDYLEVRYSSAAADYPRDEQPAVELGQGLGPAYDWARDVENARIGLSGTTGALFQYGLWGLDSSNEVRYIGERRDRGAFDEFDECPQWIAAVNQGDYDFVVTTPAYDQDNPESATHPVELAWIGGAAAERITPAPGPLVSLSPGGSLVDIWRINGPLDPAACAGAPPRGAPSPGAAAD